MEIKQKLTQKNCYVGRNDPKWIVVHETDNYDKGAGAETHSRAMYNGNLSATVHYYVDDTNIYQCLRHGDGAYAVGKDYGYHTVDGVSNLNSINIEICVNPDSSYNMARENCIWLVHKLMQDIGIHADHVIRHYDAKGKYCPRKMLDQPELWKDFKERIEGEEFDMEKLAVLEAKVKELEGRIEGLENPMIYNYIDENMPEWARGVISQLVSAGILKGVNDKGELGLTYEDLRHYVANYRAGIYNCL